jgi:hypothetical protein
MKMLLSIVLFLSVAACNAQTVRMGSKDTKALVEQIEYIKDLRTGLCFAMISGPTSARFSVLALTEVPCEKVEKFLVH